MRPIRKIYTTECPEGTVSLHTDKGKVKAIFTDSAGWWTPDRITTNYSGQVTMEEASGNLGVVQSRAPLAYRKFTVVQTGVYTLREVDGGTTWDFGIQISESERHRPSIFVYAFRDETFFLKAGQVFSINPIDPSTGLEGNGYNLDLYIQRLS